MADSVDAVVTRPRWGATDRRDLWWVDPLLTLIALSGFVIYATFRALMNSNYEAGELLSPFYSPNLGRWTPLPQWLSPAMLILWAPGGFRLTCYYYRKAYYRSFTLHPPGCAVAEGKRGEYSGETTFPLLLQNLHRYLLYFAVIVLLFLWYDVWRALWPQGHFGITVGTLVLALNSTLLTGYTFSCHSLRHVVGGKLDCFSLNATCRVRYRAWSRLSWLNENHMMWAWISLFGVMFADFYVWMVAAGRITNFRII
ncbi:MAG: succinate dehydrogenase [Acidobacteria bacterium]|nr:MAG: succinate dehydrogenase [Acidobacteriota bacterium]